MIENVELVRKIIGCMTRISSLDKKRSLMHGDLVLKSSEIHLLMFLHYIQHTNITEISNMMGITKGAVSQTLSRLEKKDIISKNIDKTRKNELHVEITEKGEKLMQLIQAHLNSKLMDYVEGLSEDEKATISDFLDMILSLIQ